MAVMTETKKLAEAFRREGVVPIKQAISSDWIAVLQAGVDRNRREPGPYTRGYTPEGEPGGFWGDYCNWQRIPEYREFVEKGPTAEIAARLMGSKTARFFHEHVLVKEPGTREKTPWHHDQPYYCVDGKQSVSFWIPLDPVAKETSPEFVAGSHAWGRWFVPTKFSGVKYPRDEAWMEETPDIEAERDQYDIRGWDLEPGDMIAFHFLTLHAAPANASLSRRRRAFAARWVGDDAVFGARSGEVSPPFPEIAGKLDSGDPLPERLFPTVWPAAGEA